MKCRAKTLYANGRIVTMDQENVIASAVLVAGDQIEAVGEEAQLQALGGPHLERIDLRGRTLYPGFIDTHSHLSMYAAWKPYAYCGGKRSLAEVLAILAAHAQKHPEAPFVIGYGFDDTDITEQRGPNLRELDALCNDRPVMLFHISVHAAYINTRMFEILGIPTDQSSSDIDVVCADGLPTGLITEQVSFKAMNLLPAMSPEAFKAALQDSIRDYNAQGLTGTIGGGAGLAGLSPFMVTGALFALEREGKLNLDVYMPYIWNWYDQVEATGLLEGTGSPLVHPAGIKLLVDGSIQAFTAAVPEGYHARPDIKTGIIGTQEDLNTVIHKIHASGKQVIVHGNGNGAIEAIIVAVEQAQARCPRQDPRHLLIHCQMASDSQLERMKKVGLWPSFFGLHVWNWGDRHRDIFLGPERAARIDPCGSAARLGLPFSLHADTPVLPQMTMRSIHTAVNRITKSGKELGPEQRISPLEAMRAYTTYAAAMSFSEDKRGSIEPGKRADFTLLGDDPCTVPPLQICDIPILATVVAGRLVWGSFGN